MTVYCNCNRFEQYGLLCRHIFCILRLGDIREFPKQYILRRWTREAVPNSDPNAILRYEGQTDQSVEVSRVVKEITYGIEANINKLVSNFEALCSLRDHVNQFGPRADEAAMNVPRKSRRDRFAELTGNCQPLSVTVRVPVGTRWKGMGKPKRMKSKREQAISQAGKKRRQCQNCLGYGHNIRTCGSQKKVANDADLGSTSTEEEMENQESDDEE